jgi:hypothetical protein
VLVQQLVGSCHCMHARQPTLSRNASDQQKSTMFTRTLVPEQLALLCRIGFAPALVTSRQRHMVNRQALGGRRGGK